MKTYFVPVLVFCAYLLHSCASVAPPKGGDKDEKKPSVTKTYPKNGTTHFKGREIRYHFSEWIAPNKLEQQIIITPQTGEFETKVVKDQLILKFDTNAFKPNTTYYINLREGVKDLTEGNIADSTALVFSTGSYLDSLVLQGRAIYALENSTDKDITVNMYEVTDTFHLETAQPLYVTKTEKPGFFTIQNIKPGNYFLYAFKDENNNGKYDNNKEYIGFVEEKIAMTQSYGGIQIQLSKEDHELPKIKFRESKKRSVPKIEFNKKLNYLETRSLNKKDKIHSITVENIVTLYPETESSDSTFVEFVSEDEKGNRGRDTLGIVFNFVDTSKCSIQAVPSNGSLIEPSQTIEIVVSKPYKEFKKKMSIRTNNTVYEGNKIDEICTIQEVKLSKRIKIIPKTNWKDTVQITLYPQAIKPVSGYTKDTLKVKYTLKNAEQSGTLGGRVETTKENIIVQLLSSDNKVLKEIFGQKEFLFEYLPDGTYKIRVIEDTNLNRLWDQGDYRTRKPMEPVYHLAEPVKLKSNWEILDLKITF